ncbi:hypothetical protein T484DRAFT_1819365 [Baffinella frigidus]|nr:hypothetical protein T484DRAFT_1819365 [Cryptophyta sp. CCMP2293]
MWRLTRDLHLLESITFMSEANQQLVLEEQPTMLASLISLVSSLTKVQPTMLASLISLVSSLTKAVGLL